MKDVYDNDGLNQEGYIRWEDSAACVFGGDMRLIAEAVTNRYMAAHPERPYANRVFVESGAQQLSDYRWRFDFNQIFPDARLGQVSYVFTKIICKRKQGFIAWLNTNCPVKIFVNGQLAHSSNIIFETNSEKQETVELLLEQGTNLICLEVKKVNSGFCCDFGGAYEKWGVLNYLVPVTEREGMWGFVYTEPLDKPLTGIPTDVFSERSFAQLLYPRLEANQYQAQEGSWYIAKTNVCCFGCAPSMVISAKAEVELYQNGDCIAALKEGEQKKVALVNGFLIIKCAANGSVDGFLIENIFGAWLHSPLNVQGTKDSFIYMGPFLQPVSIEKFESNHTVIDGKYWTSRYKDGVIRPFLENEHFGRWNYPLGVTLYGFLKAEKAFGCARAGMYARSHIRRCTEMYHYSLWDKQRYVVPYINHQITDIDMLDDCGSFSSTMLESAGIAPDRSQREIADMVAAYMAEKQEKTEEGGFCRLFAHMEFMQETLWADDLYMSVPFLCRYYRLTGERKYLSLAARQYEIFKRYLWQKDTGLFSHVYSIRYGKSNLIAWGRANGWALFSLSELLMIMEETDPLRPPLIRLFGELCESLLRYQDNGMWHQIIDRMDSYRETSCTAMLAAAFARGVAGGWLEDTGGRYSEAAYSAWLAICRECIDAWGNVYGVCKGSGFSFDINYYKDELQWVKNDTHGIGIVLIAAAEVQTMMGIEVL